MSILRVLCAVALCAPALSAAEAGPTASQVFDKILSGTEKEFVSLVAAMPADKFNFAPTAGKFDGVRNFGQQAKHVGAVLNELSEALLGEKPAAGASENGPANLTSKDQILQYVKDAFAHAHRAVAKLTNANLLEQTADPFDAKAKRTRVDTAGMMSSHTFDHYGQMVEYARMNGVVPPASQ
jgi:uncharacterized damage-inducible protein DinB